MLFKITGWVQRCGTIWGILEKLVSMDRWSCSPPPNLGLVGMLVTTYHRLVADKQKKYFLWFWRLEVQDQVSVWLGSGEDLLLGCGLLTPYCIFTGWKEGKRIFWGLFIGALSHLWSNHPQRPHLLTPSHWGLGVQHMNLGWGDTKIQLTRLWNI